MISYRKGTIRKRKKRRRGDWRKGKRRKKGKGKGEGEGEREGGRKEIWQKINSYIKPFYSLTLSNCLELLAVR